MAHDISIRSCGACLMLKKTPLVKIAPLLLLSTGIFGCVSAVKPQGGSMGGLLRLRPNPDRISLTAATSGTLSFDGACFVLRRQNAKPLTIVWPESTNVSGGTVVLADGRHLKIGQRIRLGGATADMYPASEVEKVGASDCRGPFFIASNVK